MKREFLQNFKIGDQALPKEIIDSILDERRAEFAMEENRLFDLKRTGRAAGTIKGFVSPKHDYYPVPANQLQLNTALSQRAGW